MNHPVSSIRFCSIGGVSLLLKIRGRARNYQRKVSCTSPIFPDFYPGNDYNGQQCEYTKFACFCSKARNEGVVMVYSHGHIPRQSIFSDKPTTRHTRFRRTRKVCGFGSKVYKCDPFVYYDEFAFWKKIDCTCDSVANRGLRSKSQPTLP